VRLNKGKFRSNDVGLWARSGDFWVSKSLLRISNTGDDLDLLRIRRELEDDGERLEREDGDGGGQNTLLDELDCVSEYE
jgi:hypothetical protein